MSEELKRPRGFASCGVQVAWAARPASDGAHAAALNLKAVDAALNCPVGCHLCSALQQHRRVPVQIPPFAALQLL